MERTGRKERKVGGLKHEALENRTAPGGIIIDVPGDTELPGYPNPPQPQPPLEQEPIEPPKCGVTDDRWFRRDIRILRIRG